MSRVAVPDPVGEAGGRVDVAAESSPSVFEVNRLPGA